MLRAAADADAPAIIALIEACWADYPGCVMDPDDHAELLRLASRFAASGGAVWLEERDERLIGMIATRPAEDSAWEICKVYVDVEARGTGLAYRLLATAEAHARAQGATVLMLWTDTRFARAHRFYERHGYIRQGGIRALHDASNSLEFAYAKPIE